MLFYFHLGPIRSRCAGLFSRRHASTLVEHYRPNNNNHQSCNHTPFVNLSTKCLGKGREYFTRNAGNRRGTQKRNEHCCEKISLERAAGKNNVQALIEKTMEQSHHQR